MPPYLWSVTGLILDIFGAGLLAVEAIKLDNLKRLRKILEQKVSLPLQSPKIYAGPDNDDSTEAEVNSRRGFGGRTSLYAALHLVLGWLALLLIGWVFNTLFAFNLYVWITQQVGVLPLVLQLPIYAVGGLILFGAIAYLLGEIVLHGLIEKSVDTILKTLDSIDRNTPRGTTGIIGFSLLFLGFMGQIVGTILSVTSS